MSAGLGLITPALGAAGLSGFELNVVTGYAAGAMSFTLNIVGQTSDILYSKVCGGKYKKPKFDIAGPFVAGITGALGVIPANGVGTYISSLGTGVWSGAADVADAVVSWVQASTVDLAIGVFSSD